MLSYERSPIRPRREISALPSRHLKQARGSRVGIPDDARRNVYAEIIACVLGDAEQSQGSLPTPAE